MKTVLVVGSGGREHALVWKLAQSPQVDRIFAAPGNGGTAVQAHNVPILAGDIPALIKFVKDNKVDLTVVGPEAPLVDGIVDAFQRTGLLIFGPRQEAARLEGSKAFAKQFMRDNGIPTGDFAVFKEYPAALDFLSHQSEPLVIKASGLAAGKGVLVCDTQQEATAALRQIMLDRAFGEAGEEVLIEERLKGPEVSVLAFCDGQTVIPMIPSRDHKRAYDGDQGPNTGGMGVFAPPPDVNDSFLDQVTRDILLPTVAGMSAQGGPYVGVLYAGLMLTDSGLKVLEFNCRFGDPETQVILPMLDGDLAEIMLACVHGNLSPEMVSWHSGGCAAVVVAAPGYPGSYPKGLPIIGLETVPDDVIVFHAGTILSDGQPVTSGGRVLALTARGEDLPTAVNRAYSGVERVHFDGMHYRKDIGK